MLIHDLQSVPGVVDSAERPKARGLWIESACSLFLLLAQPVIFYWRVLINPNRHIPFDIAGFHYPLIAYAARCVRQGIAPFWNPWQYCGVPIHADPQAQIFYPPTWLAILSGNRTAGAHLFYWVEWQDPLHMMLAGVFVFLLLRRIELHAPAAFMGATVYQLGAYFASQAQHLGAICCGAWLPLAILAVIELRDRLRLQWIAVLALALAMSILSGFMASTLVVFGLTWLAALVLLLFRQANWRILLSVVTGACWGAAMAAVILIPAWNLSRLSMVSLRATAALDGAGLPVESLISLVKPDYHHIFEAGTPQYTLHMDFTLLYLYCGIMTVVLIAASPFLRSSWTPVTVSLTAICAIWMMGSHTIIFRLLFPLLPGLIRASMYAFVAMMGFSLFAGITAAIALDGLGKRAPKIVLWAMALLSSADLIHAGSGRPMNSSGGSWKTNTSEYEIAGYPGSLSKFRALLNTAVPPLRIDYSDRFVFSGTQGPMVLRLPTPDGDNPFIPLRISWVRRLYCAGVPWQRDLPVRSFNSPLLDMLNVAWIGGLNPLPPDTVRDAGLLSAGSIAGVNLYRNPRCLPRFFFVQRTIRSSGATESLRLLGQPAFNPAMEAIVEDVASDRTGLSAGTITVARYSANQIRLIVSTGGPAFLVTSETMYPGWRATIDGRPQPLQMTDGAYRGMFLPAGAKSVEMVYHPQYLTAATLISVFSLLAALFAIARPVLQASAWRSAFSKRARSSSLL